MNTSLQHSTAAAVAEQHPLLDDSGRLEGESPGYRIHLQFCPMCKHPLGVSSRHATTLWFCCWDILLSFGLFYMYEFNREKSEKEKKEFLSIPLNANEILLLNQK